MLVVGVAFLVFGALLQFTGLGIAGSALTVGLGLIVFSVLAHDRAIVR